MAAIIEFFAANIGTVAVSLILLAVLTLVAVKMIENKKKGVSSCGCGCSSCPYSGKCHAETEKATSRTKNKPQSKECHTENVGMAFFCGK